MSDQKLDKLDNYLADQIGRNIEEALPPLSTPSMLQVYSRVGEI